MLLTDEQVQEFKQIYLYERGVEISDELARELAGSIVRLVQLVGRHQITKKTSATPQEITHSPYEGNKY